MHGTILLVEDKDDDAFLSRRAFARQRFLNPIQVVRDGEEAISYLQGEGAYADRTAFPEPVLLLLDLITPRKSGFEVLEWLKEHPQWRSLPVIILSGMMQLSDRASQLGADMFVLKPLPTEDLATTLAGLKRLRVVAAGKSGQYIEICQGA